ncbi:hypothetical protein D5H75_09855 [Bailinhaonella thermotolerans]|uniref:Uncharacterized protein n=2 Tax=Bailinhaonella thermotolerans TaxID=1070861 RepID=A0A3A4AUC1_9ACTN|nr:hypothetical protein D5H75_09855 [Bailinhaonella thermotolerans]
MEMALVYGGRDTLRPADGVPAVLVHPAGLGPPVAVLLAGQEPERVAGLRADLGELLGDDRDPAEILSDPAALERLAATAGPEAAAVLDRLAWGPPVGRVEQARRPVRLATASSPIERLLARGLLAAADDVTVVLPREAGLWLRGGLVHRDARPDPPRLDGPKRDPELGDRTAAGQAFTAVRAIEDLCELWGVDPPGVLRAGGLGVRDLRRTATALDVPEWVAAFLIELAFEAGLIASTGSADGEWLPTDGYDGWRVKSTEDRWAALAGAWLRGERVPGLVGERDKRDRPINVLHPDLRRAAVAETRLQTLRALAAAPPGVSARPATVTERLEWERPRRYGPRRLRLVEFTLREAEQLGVTGLGILSAHGRALIADDGDPAAVLAPLLPEPVDHVLLQADLTAVAPGPLTTELARRLALVADVESTGGATVYRFGEASVRRGLDAGYGAAELLDLLGRHSATPVPQPLAYLVEDVARKHGRLRVGTASSYIRTDDPGPLDELMADRRTVPLRLRRLAPTVVASRASRQTLVEALRAMGFSPVAESLEGDVLISRPDSRRTEGRASAPPQPGASQTPATLAAAVRAIRAGDEARRELRGPREAPEGGPPRSPAAATLSGLQAAIARGSSLWIGYLDRQGRASSRIIAPARVEGGFLTAYDETRAAVHRFALHRITGIAEVDSPDSDD